MADIELKGITKSYAPGSKYCNVDGIEFTVEDGEFFCIAGPSNSGKTSTLRLIAGLDDPDAGDIRFDGQSVVDVGPADRGASMVFENLALYPNRTGFENIGHPLKIQGVPEEERRQRVEELSESIGIDHLLDRRPDTFSGGEKQRVGIARAIIKDAAVHLMDEPLAGLDAKIRKTMRIELARLQNEMGATFIYATQDQEEALSVADRIAVVRDGTVQQIG
ncbi:MAG: ABC transporter ATP-binding protein, partial [Halanaeroarchaeum sp.]